MNTLALAVLSIGLSVAAQFFLKAGMAGAEAKQLLALPMTLGIAFKVLSNGYVLIGFLLYGLGALAWLSVLSKWDVSKAYPLVGLGFALAVGIGLLTGEHITAVRVIGVTLICAGVWMVAST